MLLLPNKDLLLRMELPQYHPMALLNLVLLLTQLRSQSLLRIQLVLHLLLPLRFKLLLQTTLSLSLPKMELPQCNHPLRQFSLITLRSLSLLRKKLVLHRTNHQLPPTTQSLSLLRM